MIASRSSRAVVTGFVAVCAVAVAYFLLLDIFGARLRDVYADFGDPRALLQRAQAALADETPDLASARKDAAGALRSDPLAREGHKTLAQALGRENEQASAALWRAAARFARDGEAQVVALQEAAAAGEYGAAVDRLDTLLRGQNPGRWGAISQGLLPLAQLAPVIEPLAARLNERPPWRGPFLSVAATRMSDVEAARNLFLTLDRLRNRLTDDEARPLLERFVAEGRYSDAYIMFLSRLPAARLETMGYLYNGDFRHPVTNLPFDWVFTRTRDALIDVRRSRAANVPPVFRVDFFGSRIPFRHVSHLLALPTGPWRFRGLEHASALNNPRGLRWRIVCVQRPAEALAETDLLVGDIEWRPFSVEFDVPADCPFQRLELELPARVALEMEISGGVAYMDLTMEQRAQTSVLK